MAGPAVVFDHVWKKFRRGETHDSLRDLLPSLARGLFRRSPKQELEASDFWALRDIAFEVQPGKSLGVIGPNGAGKSTVLKLLTRILRPTKGTCAITGRVGALIEVSAGFHPDLTGRENIYLQGAVMGMKRAEIQNTLDAIVEFSGLADFIETPIKRYSSGMNARLGFSIAAHLNPDVLIIDEVLAVGDAAFQQRCFERIRSMKRDGVTLLFVSHNLAAVEALCDETLVLRQGQALFLGQPKQATSAYLNPPDAKGNGQQQTFARHGDGSVRLESVCLRGDGGATVNRLESGAPLTIEAALVGVQGPREVVVRISILDANHVLLFAENGSVKAPAVILEAGEIATCRVRIESLAVPAGKYFISVGAHSAFTQDIYDWHEAAYAIDVSVPEDLTRHGSVGFATTWTTEKKVSMHTRPESRVSHG